MKVMRDREPPEEDVEKHEKLNLGLLMVEKKKY
jgi:hypothetical protein